jgi:uncharacterized glyoxalase superfamily protein PhnB
MAAIPQGFHTITPNLIIDGADKAIDLYQKALGATLEGRIPTSDGKKVMHAGMMIGDSRFFLADPGPHDPRHPPGGNGSPVSFYLYVEDCDAAYKKAVAAGMTGAAAPEDMFWGDRTGVAADPFGYRWVLATRVREVSEEDMKAAMAAM